jgi:hypothetical protein
MIPALGKIIYCRSRHVVLSLLQYLSVFTDRSLFAAMNLFTDVSKFTGDAYGTRISALILSGGPDPKMGA